MINSWLIFWWLANWYVNKLLVLQSKPLKHLSNNKFMTLACSPHVLLWGYDSKQKTVTLYFPRAERIYWIPKFPQDLSSSAVFLKPKLVPVNHLLGRGLPSSQERCQLSAMSTGRHRLLGTSSRARLGAHQPNVKPPLLPEYQLSTCQKDSEEEPLTEVLFTLLFYFFSFIKSHSLPEPDIWRLKVFVNLWQCLSLDRTTSLLLELLLRWSNRNLGNLMLQLSEPFPTVES